MKKLKEYLLENLDELKSIVSEINSWDGSLDHLEIRENDEEFFNTFFEGRPMEAVRASSYGDYRYMDEYVRFDGYGNLESFDIFTYEDELKSNIENIVEAIIEEQGNINLNSEIEKILSEYEDEDEEV